MLARTLLISLVYVQLIRELWEKESKTRFTYCNPERKWTKPNRNYSVFTSFVVCFMTISQWFYDIFSLIFLCVWLTTWAMVFDSLSREIAINLLKSYFQCDDTHPLMGCWMWGMHGRKINGLTVAVVFWKWNLKPLLLFELVFWQHIHSMKCFRIMNRISVQFSRKSMQTDCQHNKLTFKTGITLNMMTLESFCRLKQKCLHQIVFDGCWN